MNSKAMRGRHMLLVLGMHRSGTSALAGALSGLGVDLGPRLVPPAPDNPKGFFEHEDVWQLDHALLESLGSTWDDPLPLPADWHLSEGVAPAAARAQVILSRDFAASPLAGIKDPRMCRLMSLWRPWLEQAGFRSSVILMLRRPADVIASLAHRDHLPAGQAAWIWLRHMLEAERDTRGMPRAVMTYENLMADWRTEVAHIAKALDVDWPCQPEAAGPAMDLFLEPGLRHHRSSLEEVRLPALLHGWLEQAYAAIVRAPSVDSVALDEITSQIANADNLAAAGAGVLRAARLHQHELEQSLQWSEREREGMSAGNLDLRENLERHIEELAEMKLGNQQLRTSLEDMRAGNQQLRENLDRHVQELANARAGNQVLSESLDRHARDLAETKRVLHAEVSRLSENLATIYASRSWRLTRPLRGAARVLRIGTQRLGLTRATTPIMHQPASVGSSDQESIVSGEIVSSAAPAALPPGAETMEVAGQRVSGTETLAAAFESASGPRILIVTPDILGPIRNGGIGTAFAALADTLARAGRAVTILYTLGGHTEGGEGVEYWRDHYVRRGIRFEPVWLERGEPALDAPHHAWRAYRVYLWLKSHQTDYDIAYFPEWKGEAYYALQAKHLGLDFARLRIVVVTHSSTTWADSGNYIVPWRFDDLLLEFLERRSVEMADAVVSPSRYMLDWMRQWGWRWSAPTHVIQNLMPEAHASAPVEASATKITEWVFFGRLERRKGLMIFLDALARVPDDVRQRIQVTFLGKAICSSDFDSEGVIRDKLGHWGAAPRIITDHDRDRALAYLQQPGRLAIIASLVENSPYTVLECLLQRIPFIAADVGGIAELVHPEDRERVLFKPTPASLAGALLMLDETPYVAPGAAVPAATTRQGWLDLQGQLLREIPETSTESTAPSPHITVCLVHHDRPGLLAQAIDSLRQQTYGHFDVVLVDDGSRTTAAEQYLDSLEAEFEWRGWTIIRQANSYLGAARNTAARNARGDYVLFMDDDNLAKPHELATFAQAVRSTNADILTTVSDIFSSDEGVPCPDRPSRHLWVPLGNAPGLGVFRNVFGDANALVRRTTFLELGGFTEDYGVGHEDWEFFARAALAGANLQLVPEPLFWYRVDARSMLRGGNQDLDHARSLRPYRQTLTGGIGAALAYAAWMHHRPPPAQQAAGPIMPLQSSRRRRLWYVATAVFQPHVRSRFRQVLRESGWHGVSFRLARYMGLHRSKP